MSTSLLRPTVGVLVAGYVALRRRIGRGQHRRFLAGDSYASIAALPDWSGAWVVPFEAFMTENARQRDPKDPSAPLLTPDYAAMQAAFTSGQPRAAAIE